MILYRPTDGDVPTTSVETRPKHCFIMTQLGTPVPRKITEIRNEIKKTLTRNKMKEIDAGSVVTGKDFLLKIWHLTVAVPLGVAIIDETMSSNTLCNIFYEIGLMQAIGKEIIVVKTKNSQVPSDFVRTEYITYDSNFQKNMKKYFITYWNLPKYYETVADQLDRNPLLAIDYLRRAYLISGEKKLQKKAKRIHRQAGLEGRAKNSVEQLLVSF